MVFICRLCGKCENESSGLAIFGEQGVKEALAYKIKLSLDISVYEYDPLPKYICECCLGKLFTTFAFQESCRRTQILLRERFLSSKSWSPNATASTAELEQLPNTPIHGISGDTSVPESSLHISEDAQYSCISERACNQNKTNETDIKEEHGELINDVFAPIESNHGPSDLQTQQSCVTAEPPAGNIQTEKNDRPDLEPSQAETQLTIFGKPFEFSTFIRNGVLEDFVKAMGDKVCRKSNSRKTKKTPNSASHRSCRKKHKANNVLESFSSNDKEIFPDQTNSLASTVSDMAVVQQMINTSDVRMSNSSGVRSHEESGIDEPCTNRCVDNTAETVHIEEVQEVAARNGVYMGPYLYEPPQTVVLVDTQQHSTPSQSQDIDSVCNNTLKIVDVFSVQEIPRTSTPASFVTSTLHSSNMSNWHSPSPMENQSNSVLSSTCNTQSSSRNPSDTVNWHTPSSQKPLIPPSLHTPVHAKKPQSVSKKRDKVVELGPTLNSVSHPEEEDEILVVEIVKANKDSIAQHWEKCPSGFMCKFCSKTYKKQVKCENHVRIHLGVKPYECHVCKRRYHKKRLLNEHCSYHTGKKLYQCKECGKSFRYRKNFKTHAESHVEELNSSYLCEICGKTFQLQFDYWSHKTSKHVIVDPHTIEVD